MRANVCCLLALALLGCATLSSCSRVPTTDKDAALDAAFLQSWLHIDSTSAAKLASEGAAAATTRRELMAAASTTGTLGTQLTGAYPTAPYVQFTATMPTLTVATFGTSRQNTYKTAVLDLANKAMGATSAAQQTVPVVSFLNVYNTGSGLKVATRVTFPVGRPGAAQVFYSYINVNPGFTAPWLSSYFARATAGSPQIFGTGKCANSLCQQCLADVGRCQKCVPSVGASGTSSWASVYVSRATFSCTKCPVANCQACLTTGACGTCKSGFTKLANGTCKRKCSSSLCLDCPNSATVCTRCKATVPNKLPVTDVYGPVKGVCKACNAANCAVCNNNGSCNVCRRNHVKDSRGVCVCNLAYCQKCSYSILGKCDTCRAGYIVVNNRCAKCRVTGCAVCAPNNVNRCFTCAKGYKFVNGQCPRA